MSNNKENTKILKIFYFFKPILNDSLFIIMTIVWFYTQYLNLFTSLQQKKMTSSFQFSLLCLLFWRTTALIQREKDQEENNIISSSSGRYTVKEEVQKAPDTNHFCNLTETSVKISFPEMKSRVFVNFLGYKVSIQSDSEWYTWWAGAKLDKPDEM